MQDDAAHAHTILQLGSVQVNFYVRESSPDQWNSIGVVSFVDGSLLTASETTCRMIVGSGKSRDDAIGDLIARVLSGQHPALQHTKPATSLADANATAVRH